MQPSVRLALICSAAVLTSSLALSQSPSPHPRQQTTTVGAHSIYGTPPAEQDMMPMPLVAPVFLQTDQIDSSITVVNAIIWGAKGTITLRDQGGNVIATATPTSPPTAAPSSRSKNSSPTPAPSPTPALSPWSRTRRSKVQPSSRNSP